LFTNVFHGQISGNIVSGDWVDVPRGSNLNGGTLALVASSDQIQRQAETGGFGPREWERISPAPPPEDIRAVFDRVQKNQNSWNDYTLRDSLRPVKQKPVAILGTIAVEPDHKEDPLVVAYGKQDGRNYNDFICLRRQ
jgi:hypothetical protein